jgi:hypothetical protein
MLQLRASDPKKTIEELNDNIDKYIVNFQGVLKTDLVRQTPRRYIGRLDRGYSNQKPRGFTKQSIRKTIRKTSRSIR